MLKHSGRRAFMRSLAGGALALPLLEYTHGHAWAADGDSNLRFLTVFSHGGTISNQDTNGKHDGTGNHHGLDLWRPSDPTSSSLALGAIHEPLQPWVDKLVLLESVDNRTGMIQGDYQGGHRKCNVSCLTAADIEENGEDPYALGPSIDQVMAERLMARNATPFERIHLRIPGHQYGSPYFRGAGERVSGEDSPVAAFNTIFEGVSVGKVDPEVVRVDGVRGSVLDGLQGEYERFRGRVSHRDLQVIDAHLDHLSTLESQLGNFVVCTPPQGIEDEDGPGDVIGDLHAEIFVAALRCGLTNVANFEISDIVTPWTAAGTPTGNTLGHGLHHWARDVGPTGPYASSYQAWLDEILDNRLWRMGLVAKILAGLDDPNFMEGDKTLLDNSLMLLTSEFSNGSQHHARNQPVLLAGRAGGALETGRYIDYNIHAVADPYTLSYESTESIHNLFVSILELFGENDTTFGSADALHDGGLPGLL
jgi:hypothetical protein